MIELGVCPRPLSPSYCLRFSNIHLLLKTSPVTFSCGPEREPGSFAEGINQPIKDCVALVGRWRDGPFL